MEHRRFRILRIVVFHSIFFRQGFLENADNFAIRGASRSDRAAYHAFLEDWHRDLERTAREGDPVAQALVDGLVSFVTRHGGR